MTMNVIGGLQPPHK